MPAALAMAFALPCPTRYVLVTLRFNSVQNRRCVFEAEHPQGAASKVKLEPRLRQADAGHFTRGGEFLPIMDI